MKSKQVTMIVFIVILVLILSACSAINNQTAPNNNSETVSSSHDATTPSSMPTAAPVLEPFSDARDIYETTRLSPGEYKPEDIYTYWFNQNTIFEGNEELAAEIMESGKDPGLLVSQLHEQGITGENITVAIIDQPILQDHPEYDGKIEKYKKIGLSILFDRPSSMHGPAVTSLLAGETIGTAPGVKIYYVAFKSWEGDAADAAKGLDWLVKQNEALPANERIRAVSVSTDFSNAANFDNPEIWEAAVKRAQEAGMLVLDCRPGYDTCIFWPSYFDRDNRDDITTSIIGNPTGGFTEPPANVLGTPVSYRTTAELYRKGEFSFAYDAEGGHSWALPYATGILALGWQVNPALTGQELIDLMRQTAYVNTKGDKFLYPTAFIDAVRATL